MARPVLVIGHIRRTQKREWIVDGGYLEPLGHR
jgi:hypothetical protein